MKQLALCLAPLVMLVACSLDAPDAADDDPPAAAAASPAPASPSPAPTLSTSVEALGGNPFAPCTPSSQGICPGQILGTVCATNPTQFCLPVQGQGNLCRCAAR